MDYGIFGREVSRFSSFNSLHSSADRIEIFDGLRGSVNGERIAWTFRKLQDRSEITKIEKIALLRLPKEAYKKAYN